MKVIVAIDDKNGMMFNNRRQSQDIKLREYILTLCGNGKIFMNSYSARQFSEKSDNIIICEEFLNVEGDEFCFVENQHINPYIEKITDIYLCKWNREYPSDMKFDIDLNNGWRLVSSVDIAGKSHEKITVEQWVKVGDCYEIKK